MEKKTFANRKLYRKDFNNKSIEEIMRGLIILLLVALAWRCFSNALMIWLFFIFYLPAAVLFWLFVIIKLLQGLRRLAQEKEWKKFIVILACALMLALPWTRWYEDIRFWVLRPQMEAAAEQIIAQQADEGSSQRTVHLPWYDFFLSRYWGMATYYSHDDVVFFFTSCNVFNYSGYLYFPHGEHATSHSSTSGILYDYYYDMYYYEDKGPHWEYCAYN